MKEITMGASVPVSAETTRVMKEVEGQIVMAKKFPRDEIRAIDAIKRSCRRPRLAEVAQYRYPRGKQQVVGPSIRLAESLAQSWGNISYGIREIEQGDSWTKVAAYCWDLESNLRVEREFTVLHERKSKGKVEKLTDPRDVYEHIASKGSRWLRACILQVVPKDITEEAIDECTKTIAGNSKEDIQQRITKMVDAFGKIGVGIEKIEKRFGKKIKDIDVEDFVELLQIYNSIRDNISKISDWFVNGKVESGSTTAINDLLKGDASGRKHDER